MSGPRLVFAGTPEFSATILQSLCSHGFKPQLVLTQPDRPRGRGRKLSPSAVKETSGAWNIPLLQPLTLSPRREEGRVAISHITTRPFDALIVAAYGLMIPTPLLEFPTYGALNVHASLLPRWRGASPVEYAIMRGDTETGVSLMRMDAGLDTGSVLARSTLQIDPEDTGVSITSRLADLGASQLCKHLPLLASLAAELQDDKHATYAPKLTPDAAAIRWSGSAVEIHNQVRALTGRETAWTGICHEDEEIRVRVYSGVVLDTTSTGNVGQIVQHPRADLIAVQTGSGLFGISQIQLSIGKGTVQPASAARNGFGFLKSGVFKAPSSPQ